MCVHGDVRAVENLKGKMDNLCTDERCFRWCASVGICIRREHSDVSSGASISRCNRNSSCGLCVYVFDILLVPPHTLSLLVNDFSISIFRPERSAPNHPFPNRRRHEMTMLFMFLPVCVCGSMCTCVSGSSQFQCRQNDKINSENCA